MKLHDIDTEKAILGKIIKYQDDDLLIDLIHLVGKDLSFFFLDENKVIYYIIYRLFKASERISLASIKDYLDIKEDIEGVYIPHNKTLLEFVGEDYIEKIVESVDEFIDNETYLKRLNNLAADRNLKSVLNQGLDMMKNGKIKGNKLNNYLQSKLTELDMTHNLDNDISLSELIDEELRIIRQIKDSDEGRSEKFLYSNIKTIDDTIGGFKPGQLVVLAARPGMGKTQLGLVLAHNFAINGKSIYFHSIEMNKTELALRILCFRNNIIIDELNKGLIDENKFAIIKQDKKNVLNLPLHIYDESYITPSQIKAKAKQISQRQNLDGIFIDYLQLMNSEYNHQSENYKIGHFTRQLKILAGELGVPVFVLSQLSRQVERRDNKRPQLTDLRDSGSIEQDADIVAFLYRDYYYNKKANQFELEVPIKKFRNGTPTTLKLWYYPKTGKIKDR